MKNFLLIVFSATFLLEAPYSVNAYISSDGPCNSNGRRELLEEHEVYNEILRCSSESYQVNLIAEPGPHFVLEAKHIKKSTTITSNLNCADLVFSTFGDGEKVVQEEMSKEEDELKSFTLGSVDLGTIFVAYEATEAIPVSNYDMETNNCVHFAADIWRQLGFPETRELAQFLVDNIVGDGDDLKTFIVKNAGEGHPARIALESGSIQSYCEEIVTSQLFIAN